MTVNRGVIQFTFRAPRATFTAPREIQAGLVLQDESGVYLLGRGDRREPKGNVKKQKYNKD